MSYLNINNPGAIKINNPVLDLPMADKPSTLSTGEKKALNAMSVLKVGADLKPGHITVNADAFSKLLEIFEGFFKAMRDLLSGAKELPAVHSDTGKSTEKPHAGVMPKVVPGTDAKAKTDNGVLSKVASDTGAKVKIDNGGLSKVASDTDAKAKTDNGVLSKVASDTGTKAKTDNGVQPKVVPDMEPRVQLETQGRPKVPAQVTPGTTLSISPDAGVQVKVDVSVNCHCPSLKVTPDTKTPGTDVKTVVDGKVPGTDVKTVPEGKDPCDNKKVLPQPSIPAAPGPSDLRSAERLDRRNAVSHHDHRMTHIKLSRQF